MRRLFNIVLVSMLSLMVVYLSVGATIMHCHRSNELKVMMLANGCCKAGSDKCCKRTAHCNHTMAQADKHNVMAQADCQVDKHCMDYKLLQLSPSLSTSQMQFDATPIFAGTLHICLISLHRPILSIIHKAKFMLSMVPHAPPRVYLALISILII